MTKLLNLKLTAEKRVKIVEAPVERIRNKVCERLDEQRKIAEADIAGVSYKKTHMAYFTDEQTGQRVPREVPVRFRRWFWKNGNGKWLFELRYGNKTIAIADGKAAVEVGDIKKLPDVISTLSEAVKAGELDKVLLKAKDERRAAFKSKR